MNNNKLVLLKALKNTAVEEIQYQFDFLWILVAVLLVLAFSGIITPLALLLVDALPLLAAIPLIILVACFLVWCAIDDHRFEFYIYREGLRKRMVYWTDYEQQRVTERIKNHNLLRSITDSTPLEILLTPVNLGSEGDQDEANTLSTIAVSLEATQDQIIL